MYPESVFGCELGSLLREVELLKVGSGALTKCWCLERLFEAGGGLGNARFDQPFRVVPALLLLP